MSDIVSPIQYDITPNPLLIRKETAIKPANYHINYDHRNDCITIVKTETFIKQTTTQRPSSLPRWQTIKEQYFSNSKEKDEQRDDIEVNERVYEEVKPINPLPDEDKCQQNQAECIASLRSLDVSSLISLISVTIYDYLTWTNFFKIIIIAFCINGLFLQTILLTVQYFSYETTVDLKLSDDSVYSSITVCFPFIIENYNSNKLIFDELSSNVSDDRKLISRKRNKLIFSNYSLNYILNNLSINYENISCSVKYFEVRDQLNCVKPIESIDNQSKCFTYSLTLESNSILSLSANLSSSQYVSNDTEFARISVHSPKIVPSIYENEFLPLLPNKTSDIKFWIMSIKQLSSPYSSCANYQNLNTRFQCIHNCIINAIKDKCNCIPSHALILREDFEETYNWCKTLSQCNDEYQSFKNKCNQKCPEDCNENIYYSSIKSTRNSGSTLSVQISLKKNSYDSNQNIIFNQKPALKLELYFSSLGGLFVIWALILLIAFSVIYLSQKIVYIFGFDYTSY